MLVGIAVQFGRRAVDEDDVPVVSKLQDTVYVVRMELTDFVHHTVQLEVFELARSPFLEHVQQHDVDHGLHQNVGTFRTHVRQFLYEARVVVVLDDAETQLERVVQADAVVAVGVNLLDEVAEQGDGLLFHQLLVFRREEVGAWREVIGMLVIVLLDGTQTVYHTVATFFHLHFDALDNAHEVARLESLVHLTDEVLNIVFRSREH